MELRVEPDGSMSGDGYCGWSSDGYDGEFYFDVDASVEDDSSVEGTVVVSGSGSVDKPIDFGEHTADRTKLVWQFIWYDQTHTVEFERD